MSRGLQEDSFQCFEFVFCTSISVWIPKLKSWYFMLWLLIVIVHWFGSPCPWWKANKARKAWFDLDEQAISKPDTAHHHWSPILIPMKHREVLQKPVQHRCSIVPQPHCSKETRKTQDPSILMQLMKPSICSGRSTWWRPLCLQRRRAWQAHQAGWVWRRSEFLGMRWWTSCCRQQAWRPQWQHARRCLKGKLVFCEIKWRRQAYRWRMSSRWTWHGWRYRCLGEPAWGLWWRVSKWGSNCNALESQTRRWGWNSPL